MEERERERLEELQQRRVSVEFVREFYGLAWDPDEDLVKDFVRAAPVQTRLGAGPSDGVDRYALETFFQRHRLSPLKWMAARLGMTGPSLDKLLGRLPEIGVRRQYRVYPGLIDESLEHDLVRWLDDIRYRTFDSHQGFCEQLHGTIGEAVAVDPLYCSTSQELGEEPLCFAHGFDSITLEPLSPRHQMSLDLHKPVYLGPDVCSKLFYMRNQDILRPFLRGFGEPLDLHAYETHLQQA